MTRAQNLSCRGFSLTELAIVLGVMGIIIGGIWGVANSARQSSHVEQAAEAITLTTDAVRAVYNGHTAASVPGISGTTDTVMPFIVGAGAMPAALLSSTKSTCGAALTYYADTPWGNHTTTSNPCGDLIGLCLDFEYECQLRTSGCLRNIANLRYRIHAA